MNSSAVVDLDEVDRKIVEALQADGRLSVPALADKVGIGRATAYTRFERLVDRGVIRGFHAEIDPAALGLAVSALATVRTDQRAWRETAERLAELPGVAWLGVSVGTNDYQILVRAPSLQVLRDTVLEGILQTPGVENVETHVLLGEVTPTSGTVRPLV